MRIAVVVRSFPAVSETFILRQITGLLDLGEDVRVVSDRHPGGEPVHESFRAYGLGRRVRYVHPPGGRPPASSEALRAARTVGRLALRTPSALGYLSGGRSAPYGGRRKLLPRLAALESPFDVAHCHFGDVGLDYAFMGEARGVPLVVSFHGYDYSRFPLQRGPEVYHRLFAATRRVLVNSEVARERLQKLGCPADQLRVLHYGLDPETFRFRERGTGRKPGPVRLFTVARLVEKKGIEYALRAVARIRAEHPDLVYEIIGDGPLREPLERLAGELGVADVVAFRGAQPQDVVRQAFHDADLFLLPSVVAGDGDQEGLPNVLMEASSSGLPILSTWHSGIPEIVLDGESGFLVPERDAEALAARLVELLCAPESWSRMGRAGRRHVEAEFDIRALNRRLREIYREIGPPSADGSARR